MAKIVIEVLNLLSHVVERHKFDHFPVKIGRAYDNDLIITDPHVSAHHALIHESQDDWRLEDLASNNGTQIKTQSPHTHRDQLQSGDELVVGKTRLRCFSPWHPIPPTHALPVSETFARYLAHPRGWVALLVSCLVALTVNQQLEMSTSVAIEKLLVGALSPLLLTLSWAAVWAFAGRVIKHRANFSAQFSASLAFLLVIMLVDVIINYIGYNSNGLPVSSVLEFILVGLVISGLLFVNLAYSTHAPRHKRLIVSHSAGWSLVLLLFLFQYAGQPDYRATPTFDSTLKPPFAKLVPSKSLTVFLQDSQSVFTSPYKP